MRVAGLLTLVILFPAFVYAAEPPTLTTYTLSYDTIYPTATAESGLATTTAIDIAFSEQVKTSIKIVSASGTIIKSLYTSSSVTNPAPKVWDGTNTAGTRVSNGIYTILISATSTASGLSMVDSSKTITSATPNDPDSPADDSADTTTSEPTTISADTGTPEYLPIPTLRIIESVARTVSSGADTAFTASVYDNKGNKRDDAVVMWAFGDGMHRTGASVFHRYYEPGEYLAVVRVTTTDGGNVQKEIVITVKNAGIKITSISSRGITLANTDSRTLDLSLWKLSMGGQEFKIPMDTQILAGRTILFPVQVIELPLASSAILLYPSGEVAFVFPAPMKDIGGLPPVQPSPSTTSYESVQKVEPIISAKEIVPKQYEAVDAPAAATEIAAVGAALPLEPSASTSRISSVFKSPWTLGFLGTLILAGGAFILL